MDMIVTFPGGLRVDAAFGPYTVRTDQSRQQGGTGLAPSPFSTFLAAIATCTGFYVLSFCRQRGIPTENIELVQHPEADENGMVTDLRIEVRLPRDFPEKYRDAVIRAAEQCTAKKHLEHPPRIVITTSLASESPTRTSAA